MSEKYPTTVVLLTEVVDNLEMQLEDQQCVIDELRNWNESVAVCQKHIDEITGLGCFGCENKRLQEMLALAYDCCGGGCGTEDECIFEEWRKE